MPRKKTPAKFVKTTVNLPAAVVEALKVLAAKRNTTMTRVIHEAVGTEKFVDDVQSRGGKILIVDKNGNERLLVPR
jgi:hypothetical protein